MKFRFTIGKKLWLGFGILLLAIFANGFLTFLTLKRGKNLNDKISNIYTPSISTLKDLKLLVIRSKTLITNWLDDDKADTPSKNELVHIHEYNYVELKTNLTSLLNKFEDYNDQKNIESIFTRIDSVMKIQEDLMNKYQDEGDYWYPRSKIQERLDIQQSFIGKTEDENDLDDIIKSILVSLDESINIQNLKSTQDSAEMQIAFDRLQTYIVVFGIILLFGGAVISYFTIKSIVVPVRNLRDVLLTMGRGVLPEKEIAGRNDEIGEMSIALDNLVKGLKRTSNFAKKIGKGEFMTEYSALSKQDTLGNALLLMRDSLATVAEDGRKRNWVTEGLASFGEILRKNSDNIIELSEHLISEVIRYIGANQGGIFIINNDNPHDIFMELTGCYAWDRLKYLEQQVYLGDGLVGQSWQEKQTLYITDVPSDYISITSGLGDAPPSTILIVPMIVNEEVFGVIELASFEIIQDYKVKFVERLAETIASTISTVKVNQRTKVLLEKSQQASEQMRLKEKQLRENQDVLEVTQRKMETNLKEIETQLSETKVSEFQLSEENEILKNVVLKTTKELERVKENL